MVVCSGTHESIHMCFQVACDGGIMFTQPRARPLVLFQYIVFIPGCARVIVHLLFCRVNYGDLYSDVADSRIYLPTVIGLVKNDYLLCKGSWILHRGVCSKVLQPLVVSGELLLCSHMIAWLEHWQNHRSD